MNAGPRLVTAVVLDLLGLRDRQAQVGKLPVVSLRASRRWRSAAGAIGWIVTPAGLTGAHLGAGTRPASTRRRVRAPP